MVVFVIEFIMRMTMQRFILVAADQLKERHANKQHKNETVESVENPYKGKNLISKKLCWIWSYSQTEHCNHHAWMTFDFIIISISSVDLVLSYYNADNKTGMNVSFIRVLRLARVARSGKLARYFKDLYLLVTGLAAAMRTIIWVLLLLGIVIYICAIFLTQTIGHDPYYENHHDEGVRETWAKF